MMNGYAIRGESPPVAVKAFLTFNRATAAVALMGQRGADQFDVALALQALQDAGTELVTSKQINDSSMLGHYVGLVLDRLVADESVPREELVKLEWTFYGLLRHSDRKSTISVKPSLRAPSSSIRLSRRFIAETTKRSTRPTKRR